MGPGVDVLPKCSLIISAGLGRCLRWGCFKTHFQFSVCGMGVDMEKGSQGLPSNQKGGSGRSMWCQRS